MISVEMNILSSVPRELDSSVPLIPYFEKKNMRQAFVPSLLRVIVTHSILQLLSEVP